MASAVAVLDACVLYPAPIRDLLMQDTHQARITAYKHTLDSVVLFMF